jgi:hypothetical protein
LQQLIGQHNWATKNCFSQGKTVNAIPYFQLYMWRIYLGDFFVLQLALTPANHGWQGLPRDVCQ